MQRDEKIQRRQKTLDVARAGRELLQKKKGRIKGNRIFGDGVNAGLVLKFPPSLTSLTTSSYPPPPASATTATTETMPLSDPHSALLSTAPAPAPAPAPLKSAPSAIGLKHTLASTRPRRGKKALRTTTMAQAMSTEESKAVSRASVNTAKRKQHRFTQEELLLEAATQTEPENARWLLARKRLHQQEEATRAAMSTATSHTKLLQRYISKRGCFNTLNFSEMDAVPKILIPNKDQEPKPVTPTYCVVTGKRARYKDPKTQMGYYDVAAFKELRRRYHAGEPLQQGSVERKEEVPCLQPEPGEEPHAPLVVQVPNVEIVTASTNSLSPSSKAHALSTVNDPSRALTMTTRNASKLKSPMEETCSPQLSPITSCEANVRQGSLVVDQVAATEILQCAAGEMAPIDGKSPTIATALSLSNEIETTTQEELSTETSAVEAIPTDPPTKVEHVPEMPGAEKKAQITAAVTDNGTQESAAVLSNPALTPASSSIVLTPVMSSDVDISAVESEPIASLSTEMEQCKSIETKSTSIVPTEASTMPMAHAPGDMRVRGTKHSVEAISADQDDLTSTPLKTKKARIMSPHTLVHTALAAYLELQAKVKE